MPPLAAASAVESSRMLVTPEVAPAVKLTKATSGKPPLLLLRSEVMIAVGPAATFRGTPTGNNPPAVKVPMPSEINRVTVEDPELVIAKSGVVPPLKAAATIPAG